MSLKSYESNEARGDDPIGQEIIVDVGQMKIHKGL